LEGTLHAFTAYWYRNQIKLSFNEKKRKILDLILAKKQ
jgi:hypothetical protein